MSGVWFQFMFGTYVMVYSAFAVDDPENQRLADVYGIAMGTR